MTSYPTPPPLQPGGAPPGGDMVYSYPSPPHQQQQQQQFAAVGPASAPAASSLMGPRPGGTVTIDESKNEVVDDEEGEEYEEYEEESEDELNSTTHHHVAMAAAVAEKKKRQQEKHRKEKERIESLKPAKPEYKKIKVFHLNKWTRRFSVIIFLMAILATFVPQFIRFVNRSHTFGLLQECEGMACLPANFTWLMSHPSCKSDCSDESGFRSRIAACSGLFWVAIVAAGLLGTVQFIHHGRRYIVPIEGILYPTLAIGICGVGAYVTALAILGSTLDIGYEESSCNQPEGCLVYGEASYVAVFGVLLLFVAAICGLIACLFHRQRLGVKSGFFDDIVGKVTGGSEENEELAAAAATMEGGAEVDTGAAAAAGASDPAASEETNDRAAAYAVGDEKNDDSTNGDAAAAPQPPAAEDENNNNNNATNESSSAAAAAASTTTSSAATTTATATSPTKKKLLTEKEKKRQEDIAEATLLLSQESKFFAGTKSGDFGSDSDSSDDDDEEEDEKKEEEEYGTVSAPGPRSLDASGSLTNIATAADPNDASSAGKKKKKKNPILKELHVKVRSARGWQRLCNQMSIACCALAAALALGAVMGPKWIYISQPNTSAIGSFQIGLIAECNDLSCNRLDGDSYNRLLVNNTCGNTVTELEARLGFSALFFLVTAVLCVPLFFTASKTCDTLRGPKKRKIFTFFAWLMSFFAVVLSMHTFDNWVNCDVPWCEAYLSLNPSGSCEYGFMFGAALITICGTTVLATMNAIQTCCRPCGYEMSSSTIRREEEAKFLAVKHEMELERAKGGNAASMNRRMSKRMSSISHSLKQNGDDEDGDDEGGSAADFGSRPNADAS